jgi:RHH-type transcriptional regulator, proline utilization regulon repressor / proline dehydrogenase / delta 1-pyrroline-5-carboxylate dehydrogenase
VTVPARADESPHVAAAERLAEELLLDAEPRRTRGERAQQRRMARLLGDADGRALVLALTDEVLRIREPRRAAKVLHELVAEYRGGAGLGGLDRLAIAAGGALAPAVPAAVIPMVRERVRREMSGVILPASPWRLARHAAKRAEQGIRLNVNVLGEAVLGEEEAERRLARVEETLASRAVDYVSVKISSICSQLDVLAFDDEVERISARLRRLYDRAMSYRPEKFVNLDMEEYGDLELTIAVFRRLLDEDRYSAIGAGIVLQAYLPDSLGALEELCRWARARHARSGGWIKVRIVKGANLAMERVEAEVHGWPQAPFASKADTDANYKRMLRVALDPLNDPAVRVGVASHNLFEVASAATAAERLGALDRVEFEMLEGMSPAVAESVAARMGGLLLYAPVVERGELETAIAYLVRRLDENSGPENFIAHQFAMTAGSQLWEQERQRFETAVSASHEPVQPTNRNQDRSREKGRAARGDGFANEPDTDFTTAANRRWAAQLLRSASSGDLPEYGPVVGGGSSGGEPSEAGIDPSRSGRPAYRWCPAGIDVVEQAIDFAHSAGGEWASTTPESRSKFLRGAADALAERRGRLLEVMAVDTGKTLREGDPEVSEAVDFATYYAEHVPETGSGFRPLGTVVVASPWNFPLSIPAGGVLASLAAGNAVILKPAPEAIAVAGELAAALWEGGVPRSALQFVPCVDGEASRLLITDTRVDGVVLTGSWETARMFLGWRPDLRLHAETSGKNAIVITATADIDEAIAYLLRSAFGHAGQKCSAASLAIVEASVYDDSRFLRRLADAARTLVTGPAWKARTRMGPIIRPPEGALRRALSSLDAGERWLVEPRRLDPAGYMWSPGIKTGVEPGSEFHLTECFGPVLGVMRANDLDECLALQNQPAYGLTAGIQALDPAEIAHWRERVQAGNLYVNRGITGAIVRRQAFGGWKRSVVGPAAKAGGPNYVASLGTWPTVVDAGSADGVADSPRAPDSLAARYRAAWDRMSVPVDETGLSAESNVFRYRPLTRVLLCRGDGTTHAELSNAREAASAVGAKVDVVDSVPTASGIATGTYDKVRFLGGFDPAAALATMDAGLWVDTEPVAAAPSRELLRWVREQAVSESRHRHGNITDRRPGLGG